MLLLFGNDKGAGVLDYVAAWYFKAAKYIQGSKIKVAFVSTNSICQGEQTGILWKLLFQTFNIKIHFAHRTFNWRNEARGNAAVHVVIIGFANYETNNKSIFEYDDIKREPHELKVKNINPYLVEGNDTFTINRKSPICQVPEISYESMANDGGFLLLNDEYRLQLIREEPSSEKYIKPFLGSAEFINGINRWCLWLKDVPPDKIVDLRLVMKRVKSVKEYRLKSSRPATQKLAEFPMLFGEIRQPNSDYLLIPGVSSESRKYIPIGYLNKDVIASDLARTIPNASLFLFGVLTSAMHMAWVSNVSGRLKSDFRYSNSIVYNNFPWPENPTEKQTALIETSAQKVLDVRLSFPNSSLADLYNPLTMPPALTKAHQELDKAVDLAYRPQPFISEAKRMEFLFELYEKYMADLFTKTKIKKSSNKRKNTAEYSLN